MILALLLQAAACTTPGPIPPELAGWTAAVPIAATAVDPATVPVGRGVRATLIPAGSVRLAVATTRPAAANTSGALLAFQVPSAGRYRVALGAGVWIDVVEDGHAVASVAHGHGPACSPVRKYVDFDLRPGRHLLQVVGGTAPTLALMVARLP